MPIPRWRTLIWVWVALMICLGVTYELSWLHMGRFNEVVAMTVSVIKTALIVAFFMELKEERGLVRVFAGAGVCWVLIMIALTLNDYMTRSREIFPF